MKTTIAFTANCEQKFKGFNVTKIHRGNKRNSFCHFRLFPEAESGVTYGSS